MSVKIELPVHFLGPAVVDSERWRVVEAEIIDVAPHISVGTFAVHRVVGPYLESWVVSNVETGTALPETRAETKSRAIKWARRSLSWRTDADILRAYDALPKTARGL